MTIKRYCCPECGKCYCFLGWANRHLVDKHGYKYWDNQNVYNPSMGQIWFDDIVIIKNTPSGVK